MTGAIGTIFNYLDVEKPIAIDSASVIEKLLDAKRNITFVNDHEKILKACKTNLRNLVLESMSKKYESIRGVELLIVLHWSIISNSPHADSPSLRLVVIDEFLELIDSIIFELDRDILCDATSLERWNPLIETAVKHVENRINNAIKIHIFGSWGEKQD